MDQQGKGKIAKSKVVFQGVQVINVIKSMGKSYLFSMVGFNGVSGIIKIIYFDIRWSSLLRIMLASFGQSDFSKLSR